MSEQLFLESADSPTLSPDLAARLVELRAAANIRDVRLFVRNERHAIVIVTPVGAEIPTVATLADIERLAASTRALFDDIGGADWAQVSEPYLMQIDLLRLDGAGDRH